jgi:glycosyltransferase involved in cell wall biosynthesis
VNNTYRKNILLLIPTFADEGGTQKMVFELGRLLAEKYTVYECSFDSFNEPHVFKNDNKVLSLDSPATSSIAGKLFSYPVKATRLRKIKKKYSIDITISNLWAADLVNSLSGGKKISIGHVNILGNFQNRMLLKMRWFAGLIYRRFDRVVAVNKHLQNELAELFRLRSEQVTYINNFIDLPKDQPPEIIKLTNKKRLVTFGRLNGIKNHEPLIIVLNELKKKMAVQLVIMGAGPKMESLVQFTKELGLSVSNDLNNMEAEVIFTGFHPDPFSVLRSSDLFVFPSRSEGFGLVIVEAMYAGLPVISSDCPTGGPHVIMEGRGDTYQAGRKIAEETPYGWLMPIPELNDSSLDLWENQILALLRDQHTMQRMSENGCRRAGEFAKDKIKEKWFRLIDTL